MKYGPVCAALPTLAILLCGAAVATPLHGQPTGDARASLVLCVRDAATGAPLTRATVLVDGAVQRTTASAECARLSAAREGPLRVRLLGYESWTGAWPVAQDSLHLALRPVATLLSASVLRAAASRASASNTVQVNEARALGVGTVGSLVAVLPYTQPRSARGEVSVSLRGARREQVAVTLDGLPLTDPATGIADLADVPLVVLGSATVAPGSDPLGVGPGAVGGVLALHTGQGAIGSVRLGAFGAVSVEGAQELSLAGGQLRIGASRMTARNDFPFRNTASASDIVLDERRVNNDLTRHSVFVHWSGRDAQVTMLGSRADLGLVGPMNVRDADEDRSTTQRLFLRATAQRGGTLLTSGVRAFALAYRDAARPSFDSDARVVAADIDVRRTLRGVLLQGGLGGDRLRTSTTVSQDRARAFTSVARAQRALGMDWLLGARADAVGGNGVLPSFSLSADRRLARVTVGARAAQAVRVPTLYDLYFSSPQRLTVQSLRAERVLLDAEAYARFRETVAGGLNLAIDAALVTRTSRDAIVWFPGNFGWSPANVGTESLRGAEARVALDRERVHIAAWATWHRSELTSGALRIPTPYVPVQSAGATSRVPLGALDLGVVGRWLGPRPFTAGPRDPAFTLPGVSLLDVTLSMRTALRGAPVLITATLDNITDREWQSVRGFPSPGRAWSVALTLTP